MRNTHEAQISTAPDCIPAISTKGERGDESDYIDMEQFESECSSSSDDELQENTFRPKKVKRLE